MCAEVQQRLQQFSREVLDLLKNQGSHCRLPVSKFVSAYHQYFSRQCRVADYGFSKIIDLLSAIPKSVQVITIIPLLNKRRKQKYHLDTW